MCRPLPRSSPSPEPGDAPVNPAYVASSFPPAPPVKRRRWVLHLVIFHHLLHRERTARYSTKRNDTIPHMRMCSALSRTESDTHTGQDCAASPPSERSQIKHALHTETRHKVPWGSEAMPTVAAVLMIITLGIVTRQGLLAQTHVLQTGWGAGDNLYLYHKYSIRNVVMEMVVTRPSFRFFHIIKFSYPPLAANERRGERS